MDYNLNPNPDWERPGFEIDGSNNNDYEIRSKATTAFSGGKTKKRHRKRRKSSRKRKRKTRRKSKNKTRRKRGRGNALNRTAKAATFGATLLGSRASAAQNTQLPNQAEIEETKYQLCTANPDTREGRKLFRQLALKYHPDKYSPALRAEATVNFQTLNSAFRGSRLSCVRRTRKNKPKPPKPTPPKQKPPKQKPPKQKPPKKKPPKKKPPKKKPPKPERKPGESGKGARKRVRAENKNISKAAIALGVVASAALFQKVRRAKRAFRLGKKSLGENQDQYVNIKYDPDGSAITVIERITTQKIIEYVSGRNVDDDIVDAIFLGEEIIQDEEYEQRERYSEVWHNFTHT